MPVPGQEAAVQAPADKLVLRAFGSHFTQAAVRYVPGTTGGTPLLPLMRGRLSHCWEYAAVIRTGQKWKAIPEKYVVLLNKVACGVVR